MSDTSSRTRHEMLDLLVSQLVDFVIVLADREGRFTTWHPGVERNFGYSAEEFVGRSIELLLPEEDRLEGIGRNELKTAEETGAASDTRWLVKKGGQPVLVEGVTLGLRIDGIFAGFGKVMRDVTERKHAEDSLTALAEALDQAAVIVRRFDGTIDHWTAGCERLYGWSAQEAVGHVCQELLCTTFPEPLERIQQHLFRSRGWEGQLEHLRRDGSRVTVATHWTLLTGSEHEPISVIETQTDVTARSRIQRELEEANNRLKSLTEELERSNVELEEFARITSHDLSAPITSTRWLVDLLAKRHGTHLNEDGHRCIRQILQGLDRMADLIQGVLAHAQVGKTAIGSSEAIDSREALAAAMENLRGDIEGSNATVISGSLPQVRIEPRALNQLFQNLLSNAIKYRRPGIAPEIRVTASATDRDWQFVVTDNGIGIEPEWYERIFQPLQRSHGSEIAGSGIGLATCKKIVTRAGGRIWVESRAGVGSTFIFTLPGK